MINKKILFLGRAQDKDSIKILNKIKKNFKNVDVVWSKFKKQKISPKVFKKKFDIIISYRSYFILNQKLINNSKLAINFHPGPPEYRGIGCTNFALLNNEKKYGVTCHLIDEKIDSGKIIKVKYFKINKKNNLKEVLEMTHRAMFNLANIVLNNISTENYINNCIKHSKKYNWSSKYFRQSELEELYKLQIDYSKKYFDRVLRATIYSNYLPYYLIDGKKFYFKN